MTVPFLELGAAYREIQVELESAVLASFRSGWYIGGQDVEAFEQDYAGFTETKHCVSVANGLDALHLALKALGIGARDEVIVPSNTFVASWLAVSQCGAVPVPVEPAPGTFNIDPDQIEARITPRTKAIMPVHLYGQPANLDPILELAQRRGVLVVEDAAQAHGARYKGRRIGGHGDVVCWSFYPGKNLGALGDGGAITTNHPEIAERIKSLRNYGSSIKYVNEVQGYNSRLDPVQAAVLRVKLQYLDEWNSRRSAIASKYLAALQHSSLLLPHVPEWADPVWHLFVVQHARRDRLQETLKSRGVDTLIHYPIPPHRQKAYADLAIPPGSLPVAEAMAARVLSLPIGPQLNLQDVERTIQILGEATRE